MNLIHPFPIHTLALALAALVFVSSDLAAEDPADRFLREARNRAEYWKARGYEFDPLQYSADSMDRKVRDVKRAEHWAERGLKFNPSKLSAPAMDRAAEAILRAEYWQRWGIQFDANVMDAETMDEAAVKLQQVRKELEKIRKANDNSPILVLDEASARLIEQPPVLKAKTSRGNAVAVRPAGSRGGSPLALGMGSRGGGGRGNRGAGGSGSSGQITNDRGRSTSGGARGSRTPEVADPQDFFEFLQRAGLAL